MTIFPALAGFFCVKCFDFVRAAAIFKGPKAIVEAQKSRWDAEVLNALALCYFHRPAGSLEPMPCPLSRHGSRGRK